MPRKKKETAGRDSRGDRSRKLIKKAITGLVSDRALAEITLSDICRASRLTTGAVYFHFKDRDEAIEEAVIDEIEEGYGALAEAVKGKSFADVLKRLLDHVSSLHQSRKGLATAVQVVINTRPRAHQAWIKARRPVLDALEQAIAEARKAERRSAAPAPYLALFVLGSIEDLSMDAFQWHNPTLAPFIKNVGDWNRRQVALWRWAVLAPDL